MVVAAVTNYAGLMVLRLFLGTFEAGKRIKHNNTQMHYIKHDIL